MSGVEDSTRIDQARDAIALMALRYGWTLNADPGRSVVQPIHETIADQVLDAARVPALLAALEELTDEVGAMKPTYEWCNLHDCAADDDRNADTIERLVGEVVRLQTELAAATSASAVMSHTAGQFARERDEAMRAFERANLRLADVDALRDEVEVLKARLTEKYDTANDLLAELVKDRGRIGDFGILWEPCEYETHVLGTTCEIHRSASAPCIVERIRNYLAAVEPVRALVGGESSRAEPEQWFCPSCDAGLLTACTCPEDTQAPDPEIRPAVSSEPKDPT